MVKSIRRETVLDCRFLELVIRVPADHHARVSCVRQSQLHWCCPISIWTRSSQAIEERSGGRGRQCQRGRQCLPYGSHIVQSVASQSLRKKLRVTQKASSLFNGFARLRKFSNYVSSRSPPCQLSKLTWENHEDLQAQAGALS